MSVTISAVPVLLLASLISSGIAAIERASTYNELSERIRNSVDDSNNIELNQEIINEICREYNTVFVDKNVLLKTLEEYGFDEIEDKMDQITCRADGFKISFYKEAKYGSLDSEPYKMFIKTECSEDDISELISDISDQYTSNTQEESYNKIKKRLEKHNLEISEEEVLDDNSIVLTVNIE